MKCPRCGKDNRCYWSDAVPWTTITSKKYYHCSECDNHYTWKRGQRDKPLKESDTDE